MLLSPALSLGITVTQPPADLVIPEAPWAKAVDGLVVVLARSAAGQVVIYPVTQAHGEVYLTPAPISDSLVHQLQLRALEEIRDQIGVFAVTFDVDTHEILEVHAGPHRAGLWTIDGARTSQFDQHLRALFNLPFGTPEMTAPQALTQMVMGGEKPDLFRPFLHLFARDPGLRVHLYGVEVAPGVEIGHVTVVGDDLEQLKARAEHAAGYLNGRIAD